MVSPCMAAEASEEPGANQVKQREAYTNDKDYPSFLPLPSDVYEKPLDAAETMEDSGMWGVGRVMWTPTANVTGVRQVVDRYSITRYSMKDWRKKNQEVLNMKMDGSHLKGEVKRAMDTITAGANKCYTQNTKLLEERVKEVRDCQMEMEALIKDFRDEIIHLTELKIRLKYVMPNVKDSELIAGECIDRRTNRLEADLVNDEAEVQLAKELSLIEDLRKQLSEIIDKVDAQTLSNLSWKNQLEKSWSDKKETCELESIAVCLRNTTPIIGYHGGAVRIPENQSSPESWAVFNATLMKSAKEELCKSRQLREGTDHIFDSVVHTLLAQADKVYKALKKRIEETDLCAQEFEKELHDILTQISEAESLYEGIIKLQRQLEYNTKVVETRLDLRLGRPRIENCRDEAQYGLLEEAKHLNAAKADLRRQIDNIDNVIRKLYQSRRDLEYAILTKRKSLYVDRERCLVYRDKYPDANTLSRGHV